MEVKDLAGRDHRMVSYPWWPNALYPGCQPPMTSHQMTCDLPDDPWWGWGQSLGDGHHTHSRVLMSPSIVAAFVMWGRDPGSGMYVGGLLDGWWLVVLGNGFLWGGCRWIVGRLMTGLKAACLWLSLSVCLHFACLSVKQDCGTQSWSDAHFSFKILIFVKGKLEMKTILYLALLCSLFTVQNYIGVTFVGALHYARSSWQPPRLTLQHVSHRDTLIFYSCAVSIYRLTLGH